MAKKIKEYQGTKVLEILEGADNYNNWIASQILKYAKAPILEFGAGQGNITQFVSVKKPYTATEIDKKLLLKLNEEFSKEKKINVTFFDITKKPNKNLSNKFNTVFSSNVLEHIKDDKKALVNIHHTLKKNGKLVLLVPAKKSFYGRLDKSLGHFRRYEKNELKRTVERAGYIVEEAYFFNILGLLAWKIRDIVTKDNELKNSQVKLFDSIVPVLKIIESLIKPPVGISLIVVAKKK